MVGDEDGANHRARQVGALGLAPIASAGDDRYRFLAGNGGGLHDGHVITGFGEEKGFIFVNFVGEDGAVATFDRYNVANCSPMEGFKNAVFGGAAVMAV